MMLYVMLWQGSINLPHSYRDEVKLLKMNLGYYIYQGSLG